MAGAGYKLFNTGDVLTATEVNTYLQQQVTMVFANSTARTSALSGVLAEGMMSYLQDTNTVEVYDGSSWVSVGNTGDITGVTAGTGLTGGGTSGTVTLTNDMAVTITAKGDLLVGTGNATYDNLAVGTNGYTLVADSSTATGLKWAAASGGGKVLQVVQGTTNTQKSMNSTTYADTNLSATITPSATTSKVLVLISQNGLYRTGNNDQIYLKLVRGASDVVFFGRFNYTAGTVALSHNASYSYLDSPASTSALTYKTQLRNDAIATVYAQVNSDENSTMILLEIGA